MRLYEFEGKKLLNKYKINTPRSFLITKTELGQIKPPPDWPGYVIKAQTLTGKRADQGLIKIVKNDKEVESQALAMFQQESTASEFEKILVEEKIEHRKPLYVSFSYATKSRSPILLISSEGGSGIEDRNDKLQKYVIDELLGLQVSTIRRLLFNMDLSTDEIKSLIPIIKNLWKCFQETDSVIAEINPLVKVDNGEWYALDAKLELDDDAAFRHKDNSFVARNPLGRLPTTSELKAWQIDKDDHRGVAGSSYIELDGNIAILASGGGASLACMDALITYGGQPANYTEYSGNPPREKVKRLTEVVLSKPGLIGCWVVGGTANFTDILETLSGFLDGLQTIKPTPAYPILIRRAGPHDKEAFKLLRQAGKEKGYDFHLYGADTPMISTAKLIADLSNKFAKNGNTNK